MSSGYALDHIALGLHRIADGVPFLVGELGGRFKDGGPSGNSTGGQWSFADGEKLELIEPLGAPGGFMHRFLAARGPGIHHVTLKVPDIAAAAERVRRGGWDVVGYNDESPYWDVASHTGGFVAEGRACRYGAHARDQSARARNDRPLKSALE